MPERIDFGRRSERRELIDDMTVGGPAGRRMLDELRTVNTWLGGYSATLSALEELLPRRSAAEEAAAPRRILDVGSGAGDTAEAIADWAERTGRRVEITGIDLNPHTVAYAARRLRGRTGVRFLVADVFDLPWPADSFDVVAAALFLHHFPDPAAARALAAMHRACRVAVVINDLHRHPLAYHGFRLASAVFGAGPLVRHDGPLSVLRAFARRDWADLKSAAGLPHLEADWRWAFRWRVVCRK
jgi:SAM-dependent methyltransferase